MVNAFAHKVAPGVYTNSFVKTAAPPQVTEPRAPAVGIDRLDQLIDSSSRAGLHVEVKQCGKRQVELPVAVSLAAYRIVQESLTNVLRHARTKAVTVCISFEPTLLRLTIANDGAATTPFTAGTGHGIVGMRERALALGGTLDAVPTEGNGFEVTAVLPLPAPAEP